ncbi:hypothetical protein PMIN01_10448 [Paraphaeosphaeria minitans]|uniref:Uncharacterized protein n=1 Tax=Paraphaeosphaeria minitans TaxID=565426 RepID=A0A9P6GA61_9PLEO|nr:hypothetical protein PMIN01_10448 [Paraphaeosphaeria minitans]
MCTLHSYILPCGHMKYSHICPCQNKCALPAIEDLEVEWNVTCIIACTNLAIEADVRRLNETLPGRTMLQSPQQCSLQPIPEPSRTPHEDKSLEQHEIGFSQQEQVSNKIKVEELTEAEIPSLRRQGFDTEWMEWVVKCEEAGMDLELLLMQDQHYDATESEKECR